MSDANECRASDARTFLPCATCSHGKHCHDGDGPCSYGASSAAHPCECKRFVEQRTNETKAFDHDRDLLLWQTESGDWLVAHPWLDVITQGPTREKARSMFLEAFALIALHEVGADGRIVIPLAPPEEATRWKQLAEAQRSSDAWVPGVGDRVLIGGTSLVELRGRAGVVRDVRGGEALVEMTLPDGLGAMHWLFFEQLIPDRKGRFDSDEAAVLGRETYAPPSDAGNRPPNVHFRVPSQEGDLMLAEPPGARIECVTGDGVSSRVTIYDAGTHPADPIEIADVTVHLPSGATIADVTVHLPSGATLTEETIAIASALYWSWWRARDMHGEAPR